MKRVSLQKLHAIAPKRKPGYVEAVLAASTSQDASHITVTEEDFDRLRREYWMPPTPVLPRRAVETRPAPKGPGTELKKLLAKIGIHASPTCKCNAMAKKMDAWGPDECLNHVEEIIDVMEETAKKRRLPFLRVAGKALVHAAIRRARKKGSKE